MTTTHELTPHVDIEWHAEDIQRRVKELASSLDTYYDALGVLEPVLALVVMRGAFYFAADLTMSMETGVECVPISPTASYLNVNVDSRAVLIIDDIRESGQTLAHLRHKVESAGARYVDSVVLLERITTHPLLVGSHRWGFSVTHDKFLIGYGLDYDGSYRNLPYIGVFHGFDLSRDSYRTRDTVEGSV